MEDRRIVGSAVLCDSLGTRLPNPPRGELSALPYTAKGAAPPHMTYPNKSDSGVTAYAITPELFLKKAATYSPTYAVPSAQLGLTSLFGMGRGGTPTL